MNIIKLILYQIIKELPPKDIIKIKRTLHLIRLSILIHKILTGKEKDLNKLTALINELQKMPPQ